MAHDTNNITIQQFCDNQYIARQSYNDRHHKYLSNYENKLPMKRLSAVFPDFGLKRGWGIYYFTHTAVRHSVKKTLFLRLVKLCSRFPHSRVEHHLEEPWSSETGSREIYLEHLILLIKISLLKIRYCWMKSLFLFCFCAQKVFSSLHNIKFETLQSRWLF